MKITDALIVEHGMLCALFDFVEGRLPRFQTLSDIQLVASLIERMLRKHSEPEEGLVLLALDHVLEEKGQHDRFYQDHQEIDARLKQIQSTTQFSEATRLLKEAVQVIRQHFRLEERSVFPLIEKEMQSETLTELGKTMIQKR